jgi:hypothetical protein
MTATTQNRNTPSKLSNTRVYPVATGVKCLAGTIAVLSATGFVQPATVATTLTAVGRFAKEIDNTGGANGAVSATVERGIFRFENSASTDLIALADIGNKCFIVDNQTVAKTNGTSTRSVAGYVDDVDSTGVWVAIDPSNGASA